MMMMKTINLYDDDGDYGDSYGDGDALIMTRVMVMVMVMIWRPLAKSTHTSKIYEPPDQIGRKVRAIDDDDDKCIL